MLKIRYDKSYKESLTEAELASKLQNTDAVMNGQGKRGPTNDPGGLDSGKQLRRNQPRHVLTTFDTAAAAALKDVSIDVDIFGGAFFHVVNIGTHCKFSQEQVKRAIMAHGGHIMPNLMPNKVKYVLAQDDSGFSFVAAQKQDIDILKIDWLMECCGVAPSAGGVSRKRILAKHPKYMLHTSAQTAESFRDLMDDFGDLFMENTSPELLKIAFSRVSAQMRDCSSEFGLPRAVLDPEYWMQDSAPCVDELDTNTVAIKACPGLTQGLEQLAFGIAGSDCCNTGCFRGCMVFFDMYLSQQCGTQPRQLDPLCAELEFSAALLRQHGGELSLDASAPDVTHIVFLQGMPWERVKAISDVAFQSRQQSVRCVTHCWIHVSLEHRARRNEDEFRS